MVQINTSAARLWGFNLCKLFVKSCCVHRFAGFRAIGLCGSSTAGEAHLMVTPSIGSGGAAACLSRRWDAYSSQQYSYLI